VVRDSAGYAEERDRPLRGAFMQAQQSAAAEVKEALLEFQRYLSDQLAPMMVADSVHLLLRCPPQLVAAEIEGWVGVQFSGPSGDVTVSDCLFHALKKLHLISEFDLIDKQQFDHYFGQLMPLVLQTCPAEDRETLRVNVSRLGQSDTATTSPVEVLHRQVRRGAAKASAGGGTGAPQTSEAAGGVELAKGIKRFTLLMERLGQTPHVPSSGGVAAQSPDAVRTQLLTAAATGSRDGAELERHLQRLKEMGVDAGMGQVFRSLGRSLPGWALPLPQDDGTAPAYPTSRAAEAMHRIVSMAGSSEEGSYRFNEMVQAAIEQFNEGYLVQAMTMFDLAKRIIDEKQLQPDVVKAIRSRGQESLSTEKLRQYADEPQRHDVLRRVLEFFPVLTPDELICELAEEERRDRRKLILALIEVHGASGRSAAFERLEASVKGTLADAEGFLERNLLLLLKRIPRPADAALEHEAEILGQLSSLGFPLLVVREAIAGLGATPHLRAEQALITRLRELEELLDGSEETVHSAEELRNLLNRTAAALARIGTRNAFRTVANHAFKRRPALGDTMARIGELGSQDLSGDRELVSHLVTSLDQELPSKVLGLVVRKKNPNVTRLIHALSGTPSPAVRQALEDVIRRFPDRDFADAAKKALEALGAAVPKEETATKTLSGDVELFGLPNLLQTLADSQVTGTLTLTDRESQTVGKITFSSGKIRDSHTGPLRGESAFYQLFEIPVPGTFEFESQAGSATATQDDAEPLEVLPAILEAMRRHDEFTQARALVPDDLALKPTGTKPTPVEEEDAAFMRSVWAKASAGETSKSCETGLLVDAYRVRRLYAHWMEQGALQPV
jgi:hypothetical protein